MPGSARDCDTRVNSIPIVLVRDRKASGCGFNRCVVQIRPYQRRSDRDRQKDRSVNRKGMSKMNCYLCDNGSEATDAVAICQHCGVALCRDHVDQDLLAQRPAGLVRRGCTHNPLGAAAARRKDLEDLTNLEALW